MAAKPTTPSGFGEHLARRWNEGCTMGRQLLTEIRPLGYTGSLTHLQRLLSGWRRAHFAAAAGIAAPHGVPATDDPAAHAVPPIVAAALCLKPRGMLTEAQAAKVDRLKEGSAEFVTMRQLAMRFRSLLKGSDPAPLDNWLSDARRLRHPRDAAVRSHAAAGSRRGPQGDHRALEQRPGRGADQPPQDAQAGHVRPRRRRTPACTDAAAFNAWRSQSLSQIHTK
jgi:hypothetical protein